MTVKAGMMNRLPSMNEHCGSMRMQLVWITSIQPTRSINMGSTYDSLGKYDEAIAQHERGLQIYENAFGAGHINIANAIINLEMAYALREAAIVHYGQVLPTYNPSATYAAAGPIKMVQVNHSRFKSRYRW